MTNPISNLLRMRRYLFRALVVLSVGRALRALPSRRKPLMRCLRLLWRYEDQMPRGRTRYLLPYYLLRGRLKEEKRHVIAAQCRALLDGAGADCRLRLSLLVLIARFDFHREEEREFLRTVSVPQVLELEARLLLELLRMLHACAMYQRLHELSGAAIESSSSTTKQRMVFCDYHFEAAYQILKRRAFDDSVEDEDREALREALTTCENALGEYAPSVCDYRGVLACVEGDLDSAIRHHIQAGSDVYHTAFFACARNVVPLEEIRRLADTDPISMPSRPSFINRTRVDMRHPGRRHATVVVCDRAYFVRFSPAFIESFAKANSGGTLHLHCIGFVPEKNELDSLENRYGIAINITVDPGPKKTLHLDWRGYCAASRYIHLPIYQDIYDRIIVSDIDGIVCLSTDEVWREREDKIHLTTSSLDGNRAAYPVLWTNVAAGDFAIGNTPQQKRFALALSNYLLVRFLRTLDSGERFFFADQVGLFLCMLALGQREDYVRIRPSFIQPPLKDALNVHKTKQNNQMRQLAELHSKSP